jgi:hypothetical protein
MLNRERSMNSRLMKYGSGFENKAPVLIKDSPIADHSLHPAWLSFIRYCRGLEHGEIDRLKIQDGLPVLAEVTRKKVKFAP